MPPTQRVGRAQPDLATVASIARYPKRNVQLRQGARILTRRRRAEGSAVRGAELKSWSAHLAGGKKMQLPGYRETDAAVAALAEHRLRTESEYQRTLLDDLAKADQKMAGLAQDLSRRRSAPSGRPLSRRLTAPCSNCPSTPSAAASRRRSP